MNQTLSELRKASGYKVREVAEYMDVTTRTIYLWENGEREMSVKDLKKLLGLYRTDILISEYETLLTPKSGV